MTRHVFTAAVFVSVPLCVATTVLWVRSYLVADHYSEALSGSGLSVCSWDGRLFVQWCTTDQPRSAQLVVLLPVPRIEGDPRNPDDRPGRHRLLQAAESAIGTTIVNSARVVLPRASPSNAMGFGWASVYFSKGRAVLSSVRILSVPFWMIFAMQAVWIVGLWTRRPARHGTGLCRRCGYDLRASRDRCPECGTPIPSKVEATG